MIYSTDARTADGLCAFEIGGGLTSAMSYGTAGQLRRAAQDLITTCKTDQTSMRSGSVKNLGWLCLHDLPCLNYIAKVFCRGPWRTWYSHVQI